MRREGGAGGEGGVRAIPEAERVTVVGKSLREECGVFGVSGHEEAAELTFLGLYALQHRGQESAGIVAVDDQGEARIHKGMGLVAEAIKNRHIRELHGRTAIGHTRYSTAGESELRNAQPALVDYREGMYPGPGLGPALALLDGLRGPAHVMRGVSGTVPPS